MSSQRLKVGFLASGNGSSARAVLAAISAGDLAAEGVLMVSNNKSAPALELARAAGVDALCIPTMNDPAEADARLAREMTSRGVDLIVMSGYLRQLGPETLRAYGKRILNIHPGPLPVFGGHGMYGRRVHEAVLAAGVAESGIAIHLVDEEYDRGPVVAQRSVPLEAGETVDSLESRIRALEPPFFVETLQGVTEGRLTLPLISDNLP